MMELSRFLLLKEEILVNWKNEPRGNKIFRIPDKIMDNKSNGKIKQKIYAFIDSNNLNLGIKDLGWKLDFKRFRIYLKEKYNISTAYMFIGYVPTNQNLYSFLQKVGFV